MPARKRVNSKKSRIKTGSTVTAKKRKRRKSKAKQGTLLLLQKVVFRLATFLIIIGLLLWFIYSFLLPYWAFSVESPQNILIAPKNVEEGRDVILFAHIDANKSERSLYIIDGAAKVDLVGGYGEYQLQNIYPLLTLDGKDEQFMIATFNHALGVVVDKVLTVEKITPEMIGKGETAGVFYDEIRAHPQLIKEYLQLYYLTKAHQDDLEVLNLESISKVISQYQTLGVQTARSCPVAVVNTTNTKDLAGNISTIIEENGGLVVRVTNDNSKFTNSSLYIGEEAAEECQPLTDLVTKIFPSTLEKIPAKRIITDNYRAQLILFLGEDAAQTFNSQF